MNRSPPITARFWLSSNSCPENSSLPNTVDSSPETAIVQRSFLLTLAACLLLLSKNVFAAEPLRLRVLCYNIHHGRGTDEKVDIERLAKVIESAAPDLVSLQEVDSGVNRSHQINEPEKLGALCKLQPVFGNNIRYDGGDYGNAILSRFPVLRQENHKLQSYYPGEQRGLLEVELQLPGSMVPCSFLPLTSTIAVSRRNGSRRRNWSTRSLPHATACRRFSPAT